MKPNAFRLVNPLDSKDYEEFLNDGKSLVYNIAENDYRTCQAGYTRRCMQA